MKRWHYFTAGIALGALATRRTRRAKEAARAALAAKLTPSAIAADLADAVAELGHAVGSFASDVRMGAANRRASYRPMIDGATGSVHMVSPEHAAQVLRQQSLAASPASADATDGSATKGSATAGSITLGDPTDHGGTAADRSGPVAGAAPAGPRHDGTAVDGGTAAGRRH